MFGLTDAEVNEIAKDHASGLLAELPWVSAVYAHTNDGEHETAEDELVSWMASAIEDAIDRVLAIDPIGQARLASCCEQFGGKVHNGSITVEGNLALALFDAATERDLLAEFVRGYVVEVVYDLLPQGEMPEDMEALLRRVVPPR